jgi:uncharacterized membrane protein YdfJ with MMPL/SSD domain
MFAGRYRQHIVSHLLSPLYRQSVQTIADKSKKFRMIGTLVMRRTGLALAAVVAFAAVTAANVEGLSVAQIEDELQVPILTLCKLTAGMNLLR